MRTSNVRNRLATAAALLAALSGTTVAFAGGIAPPPEIYWTDTTGGLHSSNLDGTDPRDYPAAPALVEGGVSSGRGLALDLENHFAYWADPDLNAIRRRDFSNFSTIELITGLNGPCDVALDLVNGRIFWTELGLGQIRSASLSGMEIVPVVSGLVDPCGLRLDVLGDRIFWTDSGTGKISTSDLNGGGIVDIITGLIDTTAIDLDVPNQRIYWANSGDGTIERADLNGNNRVVLVVGLTGVLGGVGFDPGKPTVFWSETTNLQIRKAAVPGGKPVLVIAEPDGPTGLRLDFRRMPIPAVSEWGVVVLLLAVCVAATFVFLPHRRRQSAA